MRRSLKPCYAFYMYDSSFYDFSSDVRNNISRILSDYLLSPLSWNLMNTDMYALALRQPSDKEGTGILHFKIPFGSS